MAKKTNQEKIDAFLNKTPHINSEHLKNIKLELARILGVFKRSFETIVDVLRFKKYLQKKLKESENVIKENPELFFSILFGKLIPNYAESMFNVKVKAIGYFEETKPPFFGIKFSKAPEGWPEGFNIGREGCSYKNEANENLFKLKWSDGCIIVWLEGEKVNIKKFWLFFRLVIVIESFQIFRMGVKVLKNEVMESQIDGLTGVLRREAWEKVIYNNDYFKQQKKLLFLDINNFKYINDELGHSIGDQVLKMFGETLVEVFRKTDPIGRRGGDEFIVVVNKEDINVEGLIKRVGDGMLQKIEASNLDDEIKSSLLLRLYTGRVKDVEDYDKSRYRFLSIGKSKVNYFNVTYFGEFKNILEGAIKELSSNMQKHKQAVKNGN